CQKYSKSPLTF
nr:immunoglobulin light chain junction region [Macaca mulatta]